MDCLDQVYNGKWSLKKISLFFQFKIHPPKEGIMVRSYSEVWLTILIVAAILLISCEPSPNQPPIERDFNPTTLPINELKPSQETEQTPTSIPATRIYLEPTLHIPPTASATPTLEPSPAPTREPCSPSDEGPFAGVDPRGQNILWWHAFSTERDLSAIVFNFNHTNECDIQVDLQYQGSYAAIHDKMISALEKGNIPDLLVGYQNDQAAYQKLDGLVNLDPYIQDSIWGLAGEEQADFYPSFWNQSVHAAYENQRLGFALNRSMEVMFYNTSWANELGFENPPATPEEFEKQACAAANANGVGGYLLRNSASLVAAWTFAFGGNIVDGAGTKYVFDSQATIDSMTMLKRMVDNRCAYASKGYPNSFLASRQALFTQGSSVGLPFYLEDMAEAGRGDQFDMIAIPHTTRDPRQNVYGGDIMIPATSPQQQLAAWIFVKWFTSPDIQALWVKVSAYYPTRRSTAERLQRYQSKNPIWSSGYDLLPYGIYEPQLISYDLVRDLVQKTFDKIMQGDGTNIQALLTKLTEKANQLQSEMIK